MSDYHEPVHELQSQDRDIIRALHSLKEEIEAVNWYHQRMSVATDAELKKILEHNRDEEMEHAAMALEWLRRKIPAFDENLRTYLFTSQPITEIEEEEVAGDSGSSVDAPASGVGLGIGAIKKK